LEADEYRFSAPQPELESPTPRSDVYALGAMLYCLLTGRLPAAPEARLAREARLESPRKLNPDLSRNMEKVVLKALDLDPRRRYPTAAEMAIDLEKFLVQQAMAGPEPDKKPSLLARALPFLVSLVLLCCLVVVVEAITKETIIKIPWLKGWPTATYTPTVPSPLAGRLTSTPQPTATPLPVSRVVLNQIRVDQFPRLIAYAGALDDKQEPYLGLPWERWRMQQDGIPVNDFQMVNASLVREPLAVVVAIDISRSMAGERLQNVQTAVANFVLGLDPADQVALIAFNNQVRLVYDFTINKEAIVEATNTLTTGLDTALFDVIAFSADKLSAWPGRRTIVLLTDGRDTASTQHDVNGAIAAANEGAIPVFVVDLNRYHERPDTLEGISYDTRGDYLFAPNAGDLDALYQKVRLQLQNQYRFEFMSRHLADEANHALRVGLDLSGGQELWSEKGYRVP
jgi:VWFA-related protein